MPAKMARSAPGPLFGLPEVTVAVRTSLLCCRKAGNTRVITAVRKSSGESRFTPFLRFAALQASVGQPSTKRSIRVIYGL
jgi:hypothetical protein